MPSLDTYCLLQGYHQIYKQKMAILQDSYSRHILSADQYALSSRQFLQEIAILCVVGAPIMVTASVATTAEPAVTEQVRLPRCCACALRLGFSAVLTMRMLPSRIVAVIHRRVISTSCKARIQYRPTSTAPRWTRPRNGRHTDNSCRPAQGPGHISL